MSALGQNRTGGDRWSPPAALAAARWLSLAAAPTFAVMAIVTSLSGGQPDALCPASRPGSALGDMAAMYLLMSAFHSAAWLKLLR